jgi:hypothetical protein
VDTGFRKECILTPSAYGVDDGPAIVRTFKECSRDCRIILGNGTFHIGSVMDTRGLKNVDIDLQGTLLVITSPIHYCLRRQTDV